MLGIRLFVTAVETLVALFFASQVRARWFQLGTYRLAGSTLEASGPVPMRRISFPLDMVVAVHSFNVAPVALPGGRRDHTGRILEAADGRAIYLSTAMALWPDVERRCVNAKFEQRMLAWTSGSEVAGFIDAVGLWRSTTTNGVTTN